MDIEQPARRSLGEGGFGVRCSAFGSCLCKEWRFSTAVLVRPMRCVPAVLTLILLGGCAGGGGSVHHPPDHIEAGQPTVIKLSFSVWGSGGGWDLARRYTQILCHYRHGGDQHFQSIPATIVSSDKQRMTVEFVIPPQQPISEADILDYYFDFLFDGHYNKRRIEHVRFSR